MIVLLFSSAFGSMQFSKVEDARAEGFKKDHQLQILRIAEDNLIKSATTLRILAAIYQIDISLNKRIVVLLRHQEEDLGRLHAILVKLNDLIQPPLISF